MRPLIWGVGATVIVAGGAAVWWRRRTQVKPAIPAAMNWNLAFPKVKGDIVRQLKVPTLTGVANPNLKVKGDIVRQLKVPTLTGVANPNLWNPDSPDVSRLAEPYRRFAVQAAVCQPLIWFEPGTPRNWRAAYAVADAYKVGDLHQRLMVSERWYKEFGANWATRDGLRAISTFAWALLRGMGMSIYPLPIGMGDSIRNEVRYTAMYTAKGDERPLWDLIDRPPDDSSDLRRLLDFFTPSELEYPSTWETIEGVIADAFSFGQRVFENIAKLFTGISKILTEASKGVKDAAEAIKPALSLLSGIGVL